MILTISKLIALPEDTVELILQGTFFLLMNLATMQPQILLADDHSMIRKGLKLLLQLHLSFTEVSEVVSCNELMKELSKKKYTHLVLDIILSDGSTLEILPTI